MNRWRRETVTIPLIEGDARAPAEQPQLVEAPVPADTPQKRRKAG